MAKKTTKTYTGRDYVAMREYVAGKGGPHRDYSKYNRKAYDLDADLCPFWADGQHRVSPGGFTSRDNCECGVSPDPTLLINILKDE